MLRLAVDRLLYAFLGLPGEHRLVRVMDFFVYESVKITALLFFMILVIGFLRTYLPPGKVKAWLAGAGVFGNFFAALFGAVTPFCSCSSIPIFIGFLKTGIPLGVTLSFLITSPLINEYLVVVMFGFFGGKITLAYVLSGLFLGTTLGFLIGKMGAEKFLARDLFPEDEPSEPEGVFRGLLERAAYGFREARSILGKIWGWILAGVGLGALIHGYIPEEVIQAAVSKTGIFSVPIAVSLGIPMYASCAAIVPVAVVLFQKGIPLGTALAFMMAASALSLPEAVLLRRAMRLPLIAVFFGVVALGIILTGYLFNGLQSILL